VTSAGPSPALDLLSIRRQVTNRPAGADLRKVDRLLQIGDDSFHGAGQASANLLWGSLGGYDQLQHADKGGFRLLEEIANQARGALPGGLRERSQRRGQRRSEHHGQARVFRWHVLHSIVGCCTLAPYAAQGQGRRTARRAAPGSQKDEGERSPLGRRAGLKCSPARQPVSVRTLRGINTLAVAWITEDRDQQRENNRRGAGRPNGRQPGY
jgi:hypothetical protein